MEANLRRWIGLGGLFFVVLVIVAVALTSSVPDNTASAAKVWSYYSRHKGANYVSGYVLEAAVIVGLVFFWYLRNWLIDAGADARLTTLGFAGAVVFGVSGAVGGGMKFAMADAVNHVTPTTLQGLNVVQQDLNFVLAGVGSALFLFATSIAILRSGALAKWLGWLGIVMGVASLLVVFGPIPARIWVLVTCIVLLTSKAPAPVTASATT